MPHANPPTRQGAKTRQGFGDALLCILRSAYRVFLGVADSDTRASAAGALAGRWRGRVSISLSSVPYSSGSSAATAISAICARWATWPDCWAIGYGRVIWSAVWAVGSSVFCSPIRRCMTHATSGDDLRQMTERMECRHDGCAIALSMRIRRAELGTDGQNLPTLLHAADQRLYEVKQGGRNRVVG